MNYKTFAERIKNGLQIQMGEDYRVEIKNFPRNNRSEYEVLAVLRLFPVESKISKCIDMEGVYQEYLEGRTLQECVNDLAELFQKECRKRFDTGEDLYQWELAKKRIYPMLVTRDGNEMYLSSVVHRPFLNLEIAYYIVVDVNGKKGSVKVTNTLRDQWPCSEDEMYNSAMENLEHAGYEIVSIGTLLDDMEGIPVSEENGGFLYVLTNESRYLGAAGILSQRILQMCAEKVRGNFYLLPSSVHEMLVVPDEGTLTAEELLGMVKEVNRTQLSAEDYLCDAVFYYNAEKQKIEVCQVNHKE